MKSGRKARTNALGQKGRQTRQEIVRRAAPLFNRQGFAATSMSDLMQATGLQKGGLYRHFPSKESLAQEAFDYTWEKAVSERLDGVDKVPGSIPRLKAMIDNFVEKRAHLVPGGCPLLNTAIESDDGNPPYAPAPAKPWRPGPIAYPQSSARASKPAKSHRQSTPPNWPTQS